MKKENILFVLVGLFIGFCVGFFLANNLNRSAVSQTSAVAQNPTDAPFPNQQAQSAADIKEAAPATGKPLADVSEKLDRARDEPNNFDAQMQAGSLYLQIKGTDKALEFFDKAAQINPKEYDKIVRLGNGYFDIGQFEKAEKWYAQAIAQKPDDINVRTDLGITFVERANPDLDRAVKEFQTVLKTNPKFEPAIYNLAITFYKKGDAAQVDKSLVQLKEINPQSQLSQRLQQIIAQ